MTPGLRRLARWLSAAAHAPHPDIARELSLTAALPHDTRRVVTLCKVYGLRPGDIAARLTLSERAVEQHLVTAALAFAGSCGRQTDCARAPTAWGHDGPEPPPAAAASGRSDSSESGTNERDAESATGRP
jgi:hypothetical protein